MNIEHLVTMANQIGAFFETMPREDEAQTEIRDHIRKYWTPTMRRTLLEHASSGQTPSLSPLVRAALTRYAADLRPGASP